ncbi:hypothetical protein [Rossellomorea sp. LjRoot5]|uniref:hypothetical protein n=1 Tax=Rossellomorea sp. LjRoot5 TaxID=3342331 RepID=UPI003ECC3D46
MKNWSSSFEKIMFYLLSVTILVDFVNGIIPMLPIGEVYRTIVLLVSVIFIFKTNASSFAFVSFVISYLLINSLVSFTNTLSTVGLLFDLKMALKAIYFIIIFMVLRSLFHVGKLKLETVRKIIIINLYYTPVLFLMSYVLGIGKTSYESAGVGFKGTFLSLNSINVSMIVMFIFAIDSLFRDKNKFRWLIVTIAILVPMILLGTKSSWIFIIFIPLFYMLININLNFRISLSLGKFILIYWTMLFGFLVSLFLLFNGVSVSRAANQFEQFFTRQSFLFENRDILTYLLSGRNWMLEDGTQLFFNDLSIIKLLFGTGYFSLHNEMAYLFWGMGENDVRPIELDVFDIFYSYGTVGLCLTYGFFLYQLFRSFYSFTNKKAQPYFVALVSLLIFSVTGGHVFLEAISSTFLGISLAGWYITGKMIEEEKVQ